MASFLLTDYHGPPQRVPGREVELQTHEGFAADDVIITKAGDGTNPGIILHIIESFMAHERRPGVRPSWPGPSCVFAEIEEIRSGRVMTTLLDPDFIEHANAMVTIAAASLPERDSKVI